MKRWCLVFLFSVYRRSRNRMKCISIRRHFIVCWVITVKWRPDRRPDLQTFSSTTNTTYWHFSVTGPANIVIGHTSATNVFLGLESGPWWTRLQGYRSSGYGLLKIIVRQTSSGINCDRLVRSGSRAGTVFRTIIIGIPEQQIFKKMIHAAKYSPRRLTHGRSYLFRRKRTNSNWITHTCVSETLSYICKQCFRSRNICSVSRIIVFLSF